MLDALVQSMRWHRTHERATLYSVLNAGRAWRFAAADVLGAARVRYEDAIYQAWPDRLLDLLHDVGDEVGTLVLVGHAPGVPDLADRLNRVTGTGPLGDYRTSAVAVFGIGGSWSELGPATATLTAFEVPRG